MACKIKKDGATLKLVEEMKDQEIEHLQYFNQQIIQQKVRPTLLQPLWHFGGFALGFATAIINKKTAMICTAAVEEVINLHYQEQIEELQNYQQENSSLVKELEEKISKFQADEVHHQEIAYNHQAKESVFFVPLSFFIKKITKTAIFLSKRI